ncbi:MAG: CDP-alcohol phosphatidyltransferase family protein [Maricaulaceae bacterium]|nr:CDP-alcohol phosphatidyltransferase family protein [Maricaulaceae bacterium]
MNNPFAFVPNALTLLRLVIGPAAAACLWVSFRAGGEDQAMFWWALALAGFLTGALSDGLDGWLARRLKAESRLGALLDPIADKVFTAAFLVAFILMTGAWAVIAPAGAIIARDLVVTGLRLTRANDADPLPVTFASKVKTVIGMAAIGWFFMLRILPAPDEALWPLETWIALLWFAAAVSVYTGAAYVWRAFRRRDS